MRAWTSTCRSSSPSLGAELAQRAVTLGCAGVIALASSGLAGCKGERTAERPRQIFPDLDNQPKYKAQTKSHFFHDYVEGEHDDEHHYGRSQREPIVGTVAFGRKPFAEPKGGVDFSKRSTFLQEDLGVFEGARYVRNRRGSIQYDDQGAPQTEYLERMPIEQILGVSAMDPSFDQAFAEFVDLGRENFSIYCIVCHGGSGAGDGTVGQRWAYPLPSWHDPQYLPGGEKGADGYLFHTLLYGVPNEGEDVPFPYKMRGYMGKISRHEAWAIVAYIRSLQTARQGTIDDVPPDQRQRLLDSRAEAIESQRQAPGMGEEGGS